VSSIGIGGAGESSTESGETVEVNVEDGGGSIVGVDDGNGVGIAVVALSESSGKDSPKIVEKEVGVDVVDAICAAVGACVKDGLGLSVGEVVGAVRDTVGDLVGTTVRDGVRAAVGKDVGADVRYALGTCHTFTTEVPSGWSFVRGVLSTMEPKSATVFASSPIISLSLTLKPFVETTCIFISPTFAGADMVVLPAVSSAVPCVPLMLPSVSSAVSSSVPCVPLMLASVSVSGAVSSAVPCIPLMLASVSVAFRENQKYLAEG
jgi:hypothetical protein